MAYTLNFLEPFFSPMNKGKNDWIDIMFPLEIESEIGKEKLELVVRASGHFESRYYQRGGFMSIPKEPNKYYHQLYKIVFQYLLKAIKRSSIKDLKLNSAKFLELDSRTENCLFDKDELQEPNGFKFIKDDN